MDESVTSPENKNGFNLKHLKIVGEIDYRAKSFRASAIISLDLDDNTPRIDLEAVDFTIRAVRVGNEGAEYSYDGKIIRVDIPGSKQENEIDITVDYTVMDPPLGMYFITQDKYGNHVQPQVWTLGEGQTDDFQAQEDNKYWFPYIPGPGTKSTSETVITVDKPQEVISNGVLIGVEDSGSKRTYHWRMDKLHSQYLVSIVAGEFDTEEEMLDDIKLMYLVPKGSKANIKRTFAETKDIFRFYEDYTGVKYPHSKFSQTCVYEATFGGMENTTANTMTERTLHDDTAHIDFSSEENIGHHMAHQWFGDIVTCGTWEDVWLNEGLAAFLYAMYVKKYHGNKEYRYHLLDKLDNYLNADDSRGVSAVYPIHDTAPKRAFDRFNSEKGALVMCSLENTLGSSVLKRTIEKYFQRYMFGTALTADLLELLKKESGKDITWFFDQYIYASGYPILEYTHNYDETSSTLTIRFRQLQDIPREFRLDFNVDVGNEDGSYETYPVTVRERDVIHQIRTEKAPHFVCIDPDLSVVGKVITPIVQDLNSKIKHDPHLTCKIRAIRTIGNEKDLEVVSSLEGILAIKDEHWAIGSEAAMALGRICTNSSLEVLKDNVKHPNPKVRRSVFRSLGQFSSPEVRDILVSSLETEKSYYIKGEILHSLGKTGYAEELNRLIQGLSQPSHENAIALGAIRGIAALGTDECVGVLLNIVNSMIHKRLKVAAISEFSNFLANHRVKNELMRLIGLEDKKLRETALGVALKSDDAEFKMNVKDKFIERYYRESHSATLV